MKQLDQFWRPVLLLVSGNGLGQLLTFMALPFLTRLYPPEAFGIFSVFVAIVITLAVIVNGGYEWAIMLPGNNEEAVSLVKVSLWTGIGMVLLVVFGIITIGEDILEYFRVDFLLPWKWLIPLSLIFEGVIQPLRMLINRIRQYRMLAISRVGKSVTQAIVSLITGYLGWGFEGLIWGFLAGQFVCCLLLVIPYIRWKKSQDFAPSSAYYFMRLRNQYGDFPRYSILSALLTTASKQLPFFLIPLFFVEGVNINGLFGKAEQLLLAPVGLISASVGNVFFERASQAKRKGGGALATETRDTLIRLSVMGLPFLLSILIAGPWLFKWVLGDPWETAGEYARWLSPAMYLLFISSPLSCLVDIQRLLKPFLLLNFFVFLARFILLWTGGNYLSPMGMVQLYGLGGILVVGLQLSYLLYAGLIKD